MRPIQPRRRLRAALICTALVACLALPAGASADTGSAGGGTAQVTVATAVPVTAKVAAVVDVSFTCDPFLIMDWEQGRWWNRRRTPGVRWRHLDPGIGEVDHRRRG